MTTSRLLLLTISVLLLTTPVLADYAHLSSNRTVRSFDVLEYGAEIEPNLATSSLTGKVTIRFRALAKGLSESS